MRYADLAYLHVKSSANDPVRASIIDERARRAGFGNTAHYIDHLQGQADTRSFVGIDQRTCWVNERAKVYGWNSHLNPAQSTVIPARKAAAEFEHHRSQQAKELGVAVIPEQGPLSDQERMVPPGRMMAPLPEPDVDRER